MRCKVRILYQAGSKGGEEHDVAYVKSQRAQVRVALEQSAPVKSAHCSQITFVACAIANTQFAKSDRRMGLQPFWPKSIWLRHEPFRRNGIGIGERGSLPLANNWLRWRSLLGCYRSIRATVWDCLPLNTPPPAFERSLLVSRKMKQARSSRGRTLWSNWRSCTKRNALFCKRSITTAVGQAEKLTLPCGCLSPICCSTLNCPSHSLCGPDCSNSCA